MLAEAVLAVEVSVGDAVEVKLLTQGKKKKVSVCRRGETDAES